ncbi:hypothetical protein BN440_1356 [Erwinia amylovora MR1]|nr:hypothetical protein BN440_1356 [Erwinia amylovora MR1]
MYDLFKYDLNMKIAIYRKNQQLVPVLNSPK